MRVLFIGDIVGRNARNLAYKKIKLFKQNNEVDVVIVNVENSAGGFGVTREICENFFNSGADALTTGNHVWDKKEIIPYLNETDKVLRPLNMVEGTPGVGLTIINTDYGLIGVANLMTNLFMMRSKPVFDYIDIIKKKFSKNENVLFSIVDVHGEATSEKLALGFSLDGHVSAVVGTHTHVPTADYRIMDNGTAYITDVGMSGDYNSVIGMEKDLAIKKFQKVNEKTSRLEVSMGEPTLCGVLIETEKNGLAKSIKPVRIGGVIDNVVI
jgi:metallophosphoesterase (TIGR00282 family)